MAVLPADLIYPTGELRSEWFSGEDLTANLAVWLAEGEDEVPAGSTEAQTDAVSKPFAYWRAYDAKTMQMAASPDSVQLVGELSRTQVQGRKFFQAKAAQWREAFEAALASTGSVGEPNATAPARASGSVAFAQVW